MGGRGGWSPREYNKRALDFNIEERVRVPDRYYHPTLTSFVEPVLTVESLKWLEEPTLQDVLRSL